MSFAIGPVWRDHASTGELPADAQRSACQGWSVAVFLAWTDSVVDVTMPGPWVSMHRVADDVVLIETSASLSRVYHELKWSLPAGGALLVAPLTTRPKLARVATGTLTWIRTRLP
jgi:hypothetical protein